MASPRMRPGPKVPEWPRPGWRSTIVGGLSVAIESVHALAGALPATDGFSGAAMFLTMLSGVTALAWILVLAAWAWRLPRR